MTWEDERNGILNRVITVEKCIAQQEERMRGLDSRLIYIQERLNIISDKIDELTILQYARPSWLVAGIFAIIASVLSGLLVYALT